MCWAESQDCKTSGVFGQWFGHRLIQRRIVCFCSILPTKHKFWRVPGSLFGSIERTTEGTHITLGIPNFHTPKLPTKPKAAQALRKELVVFCTRTCRRRTVRTLSAVPRPSPLPRKSPRQGSPARAASPSGYDSSKI